MPRSCTSTKTRSLPLSFEALDHAEGELARYYTRRQDKRRRGGWRDTVEATLAAIPAYHRGVFSLHYADRSWPDAIRSSFGPYASLAIRLDCCDHPATGSTPSLEAVAAERLAAVIARDGSGCATVTNLHVRAGNHFASSLRAYAKARRKHRAIAPTRAASTTAARTELDQAAE
jgi:hypothetical protein